MNTKDSVQTEDEIDVMAALDLLMKSSRLIIVVTACFILLGCLWMIVARPVYRADITIQVESSTDLASAAVSNIMGGGISSLFDIKSTDDGEMEILHSRLVTNNPVDQLSLYISAEPKRFPLFGNWIARHTHGSQSPGLFGLGGYAWGREKIEIGKFDVPSEFEGDKFIIRITGRDQFRLSGSDFDSDAYGSFGHPLSVQTETGTLTLLVKGVEGAVGTEFVIRRHSRQEVQKQLQKDLDIKEKGKEQSGVIGVSYDDVDPARAASVLNVIADSYVRQNQQRKIEAADQSLQFLKQQLPGVHQQLEVAEDRLTDYQNKHKLADLSEQTKSVLAQAAQLQATIFDLSNKRTQLLSTLSPKHPSVIALDAQIAAARASLADFDESLAKTPNEQQGYVRLTRDVQVQTQIYVGLLNSIQQLELTRAGGVGTVRVIDRATVSEEPQRPKAIIVLPLSVLLGLATGIIAALARSALAGRITDPVEIEQRALLDVIAAVPVSTAQRQMSRIISREIAGPAVLAMRAPRDPAVEALRKLRMALQFALAEKANARVVLLTGPTQGVGKSFTSSNLAILFGLSDKRTLLIDADLRRGHLRSEFRVSKTALGLSDVLKGTKPIEEAIVRNVAENVDLLTTGQLMGHPDELFEKARIIDVIRNVSKSYDVVLIDSPPVLPVTDTTILAPAADLVILVTRSGVTTRGEILETAKRLQRSGVSVRDVVFNSFKVGLRSQQYGYGEYYKTDTENPTIPMRRKAIAQNNSGSE